VRAAAAGYLAATRSEVASLMVEDGHVGLYVRGVPAWSLDTYVTQLPLAVETARAILLRWPALGDVDVCGDAPWLPHAAGVTFVPGSRVQLFRDRLTDLPARVTTPGQVLREGLRVTGPNGAHPVEYFLDARIRTGSAAYKEAYAGG
jgi:hypothetical protein